MSGDITRDPVFGEVARALQPRGRTVPHRHVDGVPCARTVRVEFRANAFAAAERERLVGVDAWGDPTAKDGSLGAPREPIAQLAATSETFAALLAASDHTSREPAPIRVMGVVNVTPDSFSDGGRFLDPQRAIEHGLQLVAEGADLLDVGGESTRPGSQPVSADEELCRIKLVIEGLARGTKVPIS